MEVLVGELDAVNVAVEGVASLVGVPVALSMALGVAVHVGVSAQLVCDRD